MRVGARVLTGYTKNAQGWMLTDAFAAASLPCALENPAPAERGCTAREASVYHGGSVKKARNASLRELPVFKRFSVNRDWGVPLGKSGCTTKEVGCTAREETVYYWGKKGVLLGKKPCTTGEKRVYHWGNLQRSTRQFPGVSS